MTLSLFRRLKREGGSILIPYIYLPRRYHCGHLGPPYFIIEIDHHQIRFCAEDHPACARCELEVYLKSRILCPRCDRSILKHFAIAVVLAKSKDQFIRDVYYLDPFQRYVAICSGCVVGGTATHGWWSGETFQESES